jgi:hypothetical protein
MHIGGCVNPIHSDVLVRGSAPRGMVKPTEWWFHLAALAPDPNAPPARTSERRAVDGSKRPSPGLKGRASSSARGRLMCAYARAARPRRIAVSPGFAPDPNAPPCSGVGASSSAGETGEALGELGLGQKVDERRDTRSGGNVSGKACSRAGRRAESRLQPR